MSKTIKLSPVEVLLPESKHALSKNTASALHNHFHRCAQAAAAQATGYAILCGMELQRVRSEIAAPGKRSDLPNARGGGWESWVKDNCEFGAETARKYMAVAEGVKGRLAQQKVSKAILGLIDSAPSALADNDRASLLKSVSKITEGQSLQQLYLDFGICKANPRDNLKRGGATHTKGRGPSKQVDAQIAQETAAELLQGIAKFIQGGQHQLLDLADLQHLDDQLLAAREAFKPLLKKTKN